MPLMMLLFGQQDQLGNEDHKEFTLINYFECLHSLHPNFQQHLAKQMHDNLEKNH